MPNEPMRLDCPRTIRRIRRTRGLTLAQTAQGAGTTAAQIMKLENGDRRLTLDWLERLAKALNCHVLDLIAPARRVPLTGFLTGQWSVQQAVHDPRQRALPDVASVTVPRGCAPEDVVAIRRQTLDRTEFFAGATFFFDTSAQGPVEGFDGRICLLTLETGERHVRRVVVDASSRRVDFTAPVAVQPLAGQRLLSAAPCIAMVNGADALDRLSGPEIVPYQPPAPTMGTAALSPQRSAVAGPNLPNGPSLPPGE